MRLVLAFSLLVGWTVALPAQQPVGLTSPETDVDAVLHRPGPFHYFFESLILPGWGQASLGRKLTGGLFLGFDGLAISMAMKADNELHYLDVSGDSATSRARRAERQDWLVLIGFNHLFSALEAFVSAHLIDFPRDLHLRALPGPRPGLGVTIGLPH